MDSSRGRSNGTESTENKILAPPVVPARVDVAGAGTMSPGEYVYNDALPTSAHKYLLPVIAPLLADLPAGSRILDLGSGNGAFLAMFRNRGWELTGLEHSLSGLQEARQAHPGITFVRGDVTDAIAPELLPPSHFDAVVSTEVVEHVYSPRLFAANCFALVKPGGRLILSTPYHGYLKNIAIAVAGQMDRHFTALWDHGHIKFWSFRTLSQLLEEAGFLELKFYGAGRIAYLWKSMIVKAIRPLRPTSAEGGFR